MKTILTISSILNWVNLLAGSVLLLSAILTMMTGSPALLLPIILIGCIVLHSYAAMQLRKSIRYPSIPLSKQTPVGIRLMGFMTMFLGIMMLSNAYYILQNPKDFISQIPPMPPQFKGVDIAKILNATAILMLVLGASLIANVILNFRLLRWYMLQNSKPDADQP